MVASIIAKMIEPMVDSLRSMLVIFSFFIDLEKFIEYMYRPDETSTKKIDVHDFFQNFTSLYPYYWKHHNINNWNK